MGFTMNDINQQQTDQLRSSLLQLAFSCPIEHCNPTDCPLYNFRRMTFPLRLAWFNCLNAKDLAYLAAYHKACVSCKLAEDQVGATALACH